MVKEPCNIDTSRHSNKTMIFDLERESNPILQYAKTRGLRLILIFFIFLLFASCSGKVSHDELNKVLIPWPNEVVWDDDAFYPGEALSIQVTGARLEEIADHFATEVSPYLGITKVSKGVQGDLTLKLDPLTDLPKEGYRLEITADGIHITATGQEGIYYGLNSLKQLIRFNYNKDQAWAIPTGTIRDAPRFSWRGVMLDESRHFFGMEQVKQLLDLMAEHKLNKFHWHLTDEPAWRIEIQAYPRLTEIGSRGDWSNSSQEAKFYTQEQVREIVQYAAQRQIEIIPEIDMPGHASAANRAYPEFSGGGNPEHPGFTFNPGKEGTYAYLTTILEEVAALFPSEYIHLGGDEVHFANQQWLQDPEVRSLMEREGFENLKEVEYYFLQRISDALRAMGKKTAGWDEIASAGLDHHESMIFWWRHDKPGVLHDALDRGYKTVLCPRIPLYFDFIQHPTHQYGRTWKGFGDTLGVYHFPDSAWSGLGGKDLVMGIQSCIWTERIATKERLDFMTWPRLTAMSEAAWTQPEAKSYERFLERLPHFYVFYDKLQIAYFDLFDPESTPEPVWNDGPNWQQNHNTE